MEDENEGSQRKDGEYKCDKADGIKNEGKDGVSKAEWRRHFPGGLLSVIFGGAENLYRRDSKKRQQDQREPCPDRHDTAFAAFAAFAVFLRSLLNRCSSACRSLIR